MASIIGSATLWELFHSPRGPKWLKHKRFMKSIPYANFRQVADAVIKANIVTFSRLSKTVVAALAVLLVTAPLVLAQSSGSGSSGTGTTGSSTDTGMTGSESSGSGTTGSRSSGTGTTDTSTDTGPSIQKL